MRLDVLAVKMGLTSPACAAVVKRAEAAGQVVKVERGVYALASDSPPAEPTSPTPAATAAAAEGKRLPAGTVRVVFPPR
jgi:metal-sulfur cluster biosynthetic enzyme